MKRYLLILILLLWAGTNVKSQTFSDDNFVYTASPKKAVQSADFNTLTKNEVNQNISSTKS